MKVLVTGGLGFVGGATVELLLREGYEVVVLDRNLAGVKKVFKALRTEQSFATGRLRVYPVDLCDKNHLRGMWGLLGEIDVVLHLAAEASVAESMQSPVQCFGANVVGTLNLLEEMARFNIDRLVFASSGAVYAPSYEPVSEYSPLGPESAYGESKLVIERLLPWYTGLKYVVLRYANVAGFPGAYSANQFPATDLVPSLARALEFQQLVEVFGTDYPTEDGTCVRDYVHVDDVARANLLALDQTTLGPLTGPFTLNIGSGDGNSVLEMVAAYEALAQIKLPRVSKGDRRPGDQAVSVLNPALARSLLNWQPQKELRHILNDVRVALKAQRQL